jgi:hypothetical protein
MSGQSPASPPAVALDSISFTLDREAFSRRIRLESTPDGAAAVEPLLQQALPLVRPKVLYRVCYKGEQEQDAVELGGVRFESRALSHNLRDVERVFAYVATCGVELEPMQAGCEDLLASYWLDALKEQALGRALDALKQHLGELYGLDPEKLSSMNPGSGNRSVWPIGQQKRLFGLLGGVEERIGVRLTESFLMLPNKSVSGVLFPTEVPFSSCQLCTREGCPGRRAPYQGSVPATGEA